MSATPPDKPADTPQNNSGTQDNGPTPSEMLRVVVGWMKGYWNAPREKSKWTEILTAVLTFCIAVAAIWSAWIFQGQLTEARRTTSLTRQQLEASIRPWIAVDFEIIGPITFDANGVVIPFATRLRNVGHSPAIYVYVSPKIVNRQSGVSDKERQGLCTSIPWGETIFAGDSGMGKFEIAGTEVEMNNSKSFIGFRANELLLHVIGCVQYSMAGRDKEFYSTTFGYDVWAIDDSGGSVPVKRGVPVPVNRIRYYKDTAFGTRAK